MTPTGAREEAGVATAVGGLVCPPGVDVEIAGWEVIVGVVLVSSGLVSRNRRLSSESLFNA